MNLRNCFGSSQSRHRRRAVARILVLTVVAALLTMVSGCARPVAPELPHRADDVKPLADAIEDFEL